MQRFHCQECLLHSYPQHGNDEDTRLVFTAVLVLKQPVSCDKDVSLSPGTGKASFTWKFLLSIFRQKRGDQNELFVSAVL